MMLALDRNDPQIRAAMDQAARVAEWLLDAHNDDVAQELALDVLNDYVSGLGPHLYQGWGGHLEVAQTVGGGEPAALAWAFALTERRADLKPHEEKLLDLAWEKVLEDAVQREWERMGGA